MKKVDANMPLESDLSEDVDDAVYELGLSGLDGCNPLGFLAALGVLRGLTQSGAVVSMAWRQGKGIWSPLLHFDSSWTEQRVTDVLVERCHTTGGHPSLSVGDDLTIKPAVFHDHELTLLNSSQTTDFVAAFGSDAVVSEADPDKILDTALRTMSGAGHQHFLKTMREVLNGVTSEQIHRALFASWDYADGLRGKSLRIDPQDDKRYALQWADPSGDSTRSTSGNMLGANALAVLGIPLLKVAPVHGVLETTGFRGQRSSNCFWTWPIWTCLLNLDVTTSLLALEELQQPAPPRDGLFARGVAEVYRSQRITIGKFRNFAPALSV